MAENIKVAIRVRPFSQRELDLRSAYAVTIEDASITVLGPGKEALKTFTYDFSYWSAEPTAPHFASQETLMRDIGEVIVSNALDGFNGCLFAYGQTGSGKTYSMLGNHRDPGIIPRSVSRLFEAKAKFDEDATQEMHVSASYLEIYKEHIFDLLSPADDPPELTIRHHPKLGVYVSNLTSQVCQAPEQVVELLEFGTRRRAIAATQMNASSSRSHAVFCLRVHRLQGEAPLSGEEDLRHALEARINLVDLAGSERQSKSGSQGMLLREGCAINKSLSALGMVIKELSEATTRGTRLALSGELPDLKIPFRASKLTFLLKDSLAGNSKTYMLATVSPAEDNTAETLSTLRFASSVKTIKTLARQNRSKKDEIIENLRRELEMLRREGAGGSNVEQIRHQEQLIVEMKQSFQQQLAASEQMQKARQETLADGALNQTNINQILGIEQSTPFLLNMADDPHLAGTLLYYLPRGKQVTIGSARECTIRFKGIGISPFLCTVYNEDDTRINLCKHSTAGRVVLDGQLVQELTTKSLKHGSRLFLGRSVALKVSVPLAAPEATPGLEQDLLLEDGEEEQAALDVSPSWCAIQEAVNRAVALLDNEGALTVATQARRAARYCDEANEISAVVRPGEQFHFEVQLTTSSWGEPPSVVVRASSSARDGEGTASQMTPRPTPPASPGLQSQSSSTSLTHSHRRMSSKQKWRKSSHQAGFQELLYICSCEYFEEKLLQMRDCHYTFMKRRSVMIDPFTDPWKEPSQAEVQNTMAQLRSTVQDLTQRNHNLRFSRLRAFTKAMLMWKGTADAGLLARIVFPAWAQLTKERTRTSSKLTPRYHQLIDPLGGPTVLMRGRQLSGGDPHDSSVRSPTSGAATAHRQLEGLYTTGRARVEFSRRSSSESTHLTPRRRSWNDSANGFLRRDSNTGSKETLPPENSPAAGPSAPPAAAVASLAAGAACPEQQSQPRHPRYVPVSPASGEALSCPCAHHQPDSKNLLAPPPAAARRSPSPEASLSTWMSQPTLSPRPFAGSFVAARQSHGALCLRQESPGIRRASSVPPMHRSARSPVRSPSQERAGSFQFSSLACMPRLPPATGSAVPVGFVPILSMGSLVPIAEAPQLAVPVYAIDLSRDQPSLGPCSPSCHWQYNPPQTIRLKRLPSPRSHPVRAPRSRH